MNIWPQHILSSSPKHSDLEIIRSHAFLIIYFWPQFEFRRDLEKQLLLVLLVIREFFNLAIQQHLLKAEYNALLSSRPEPQIHVFL